MLQRGVLAQEQIRPVMVQILAIALALLLVGCTSTNPSSAPQSNTKAIAYKAMVLAPPMPRYIVWDWEPLVMWDVISTTNLVEWNQEATNLLVNIWEIDQSTPCKFHRVGARWQEGYAD